MKEWLSDIKNRPIIIGIAAFVLVAAVVGTLFGMGIIGNSAAAPDTTTAAVPAPPVPTTPAAAPSVVASNVSPSPSGNPMTPGGLRPVPHRTVRPAVAAKPGSPLRPGLPGKPGSVAAPGPIGKPVAVASVNIGKQDPYLPAYSVAKLRPPPPNLFGLVRPGQFASLPSIKINGRSLPINGAPTADVQLGSVSGIIFSNGVHAIYEANGEATIVQPGDTLPDGQGRVTSIGPQSMAVRISGDRTITIPITSGTVGGSGQGGNPAAAQAPDQGNGQGDDSGA